MPTLNRSLRSTTTLQPKEFGRGQRFTTGCWEFFAAESKQCKEDAGFTQVDLGARVFVSGDYLDQFEQAIRKLQLDGHNESTRYYKPRAFSIAHGEN